MQQQQRTHSAVLVSLPFDLERMIFELAAREQHSMDGGIMHILLVCHRVKEWIEGIIYESLILDAPLLTTRLLLRTLASKTGRHEFFARTVKRVYLSPIVSAEEAAFVLSMCTGAKEIVSWAPEIGRGSKKTLPDIAAGLFGA
ncbi:hypothetical protein D9619_003943 [Psilocybe cf. subviscida]|uniref:Uncharacterized protein n=1 Tax=Psilocybe cf. subviscida TaxID=2480587 RepID=A0A8H5BPN3_9AGAR|nr:hypothetical protein D9619_003943 [Psilocybe cf. subviscida]